MSYLSFNQRNLVNLEYALQREFLGTNQAGGYCSTTLNFCNTRRYHGLLVLPIDNFKGQNHVLLSSLDETVVIGGKEFNFGIHKYPDTYEPKGHKYITEAEFDKYYSITYQVGGVILRKDVIMLHHEPQVLIRYTLLGSHKEVKLRLKPFLAFRDVHKLSEENSVANTDFQVVENGIGMRLYDNFPMLYMQLSRKNEYLHEPYWYKNITYLKDEQRGGDYVEDLLVSGHFELVMKKGETIVFSASTQESNPQKLVNRFASSCEKRPHRDSFLSCLKLAAKQFIIHKKGETRIKAGYPWHISYGRDTFLSLPGIAAVLEDVSLFEKVISSMQKYFIGGLFTRIISSHAEPQYNADTSLWFFWAMQQYEKMGQISAKSLWKKYKTFFISILESYRDGSTFEQVKMKDNGLIYNAPYYKPLTWMNGRINGRPVLERNGYVVEINALWYNAVVYALSLATEAKDKEFCDAWQEFPERIKNSFQNVFWSEEWGYLADTAESDTKNMSIRPNQIIACALNFSPLENYQKKKIVDVVSDNLLTNKGLRTLSPDNENYNGLCEGTMGEQEKAIYQGGVHTWLLSFYIETCFNLYGKNFVPQAEELLSHVEEDLRNFGLSSFSEFYDGNPPHNGHGCISQARNTAEIIRSLQLLKSYQNKK